MSEFKRENRYLVLHHNDINKYLNRYQKEHLLDIEEAIADGREDEGKNPYPKFVCVKDTYPEYEYVWKCIEERVTKENKNSN